MNIDEVIEKVETLLEDAISCHSSHQTFDIQYLTTSLQGLEKIREIRETRELLDGIL